MRFSEATMNQDAEIAQVRQVVHSRRSPIANTPHQENRREREAAPPGRSKAGLLPGG
jgi:hypothetical protein